MATEVFSNFVNTTLAGSIGPGATTFTVASGTGASLPQPAAGQFGRLIFTDQLTGAAHEIITYTSISGDTVSGVTRGGSPLSWSAGDIILCGPTAQTMQQFTQGSQAQSNSATYAQDTGSANAYVISPSPAISGTPDPGTRLYFKAVAANTGASTLTVNGTLYPLTGNNGALAANEIVANGNVVVAWNSTYSGFELVSCTRAEVAVPSATANGHAINLGQANSLYSPIGAGSAIQGDYKNLKGSSTGLSALASYTADQLIVEDGSGGSIKLTTVSVTPSLAALGVNGLDAGISAASTWYSVWVIRNTTTNTTAGLLSLSATAPTMPSGYTHKARVGWVRSDATANKYPLSFIQYGNESQYKLVAASNVVTVPQMASISATIMTAIAVGAFVPPTASSIRVNYGSGTNTSIMVAPNSQYSTALSGPTPQTTNAATAAQTTSTGQANIVLESTNIYAAVSASTGSVYCSGWKDNF